MCFKWNIYIWKWFMFEPVRTCIEPEPCLNLAEPNMNIMSSSCSQIFKKFGHVHVQVREKVPEPDLNRTSATLPDNYHDRGRCTKYPDSYFFLRLDRVAIPLPAVNTHGWQLTPEMIEGRNGMWPLVVRNCLCFRHEDSPESREEASFLLSLTFRRLVWLYKRSKRSTGYHN